MGLETYTPEAVTDMAQVYHDLVNNPATRDLVLRATKKINPSLNVPELELKDQLNALAQQGGARIQGLENKLHEYEIKEKIAERRNELKKEFGLRNSDIDEIEKLMVDKGIPNHKSAAEFYKMQKESAKPTPSAVHTPVTLPQDSLAAMSKGGQSGLNQWARGEAYAALDDIMKGRR